MDLLEKFTAAAQAVGAEVVPCQDLQQAVDYLAGQVDGPLLCPEFASAQRSGLRDKLTAAGLEPLCDKFRQRAPTARARRISSRR